MSNTDPSRARVAKRIAASQDRLKRGSDQLPAKPQLEQLPDAWPPENYRTLAKEYPWLAMAAALGAGALVAALLPRKFVSKAGRRARRAGARTRQRTTNGPAPEGTGPQRASASSGRRRPCRGR